MTDKLKQAAEEEIVKLPKEMQDAINTIDWVSISEDIGKKYLRNASEINDLQVETLLILVGMEILSSYAENIEDNIGTTQGEAKKIALEVDQKIFIPISDMMAENIKKNMKSKNPNAEQTLNFILSGGDYSSFIEERNDIINNKT
jgi:hypothetical protein